MSDTAAKLDILIDIQAKLSELLKVQQGVKETKEEAMSLGALFRQGLGIGTGMEIARRSIELFKSAVVSTVRESFVLAGAIKDQAESLQISTDAYQVLGKVMRDAGGDMATLTQLIAHNNRSLAEARNLTGPAANAYRVLGLDSSELEGLSVERRLERIGRAIAGAKDQTAAYGAASQIVGTRNLPLLISALRSVAAGYDQQAEAAKRAGQVMEFDAIKRLDAAKKQIEELRRAITIFTGEAIGDAARFMEAFQKDKWGLLGAYAQSAAGNLFRIKPDWSRFDAKMNELAPVNTPGDDSAEREARANAAAAEAARRNALANAELAVAKAALNREAVESDPLISSEICRREKTSSGINDEVAARWRLIAALKAMSLDETSDTLQTRAARIAKMESEAMAMNRRGVALSLGGTQRMSQISDAYSDRGRGGLNPVQGGFAGFMQFGTAVGTSGDQIADTITGTIGGAVSTHSDGIQGLITKTKTWGDVGRAAGSMFLQALIQLGVQLAINWAISKVIGEDESKKTKKATAEKAAEGGMKSIAQLGPIWGTLAFAASIAAIFALLGGFREAGGPVTAGVPYVVGEKRAEVFVPNQSGMIVPSVGEFQRTSPGLTASAAVGASKPRMFLMRPSTEQEFEAMKRSPLFDVAVVDTVMRHRGDILNG